MTEESREVPIEWFVPEDLISRYAHNAIVQNTGSEFVISFFETLPPLVVGTPEEINAQLESLEAIRATCVARIILPPDQMETLIDALQNNYERYLARMADARQEQVVQEEVEAGD